MGSRVSGGFGVEMLAIKSVPGNFGVNCFAENLVQTHPQIDPKFALGQFQYPPRPQGISHSQEGV